MSALAGTASLVRLALRRDRIIFAVVIVVLVASVAASASATVALYPDRSSRMLAAAAVNGTSSTLALYGPIHDETSIGALATFKMGMIGAIAVAVFSLLIVVRHTRTEEETGRLELLGSTVVGRRAPLTAALLIAVAANVVLGIAVTAGMIAVGMEAAGSAMLGLGFVGIGLAFAAVAGLTAQLTRSARTASGIAAIVLGASYLLRAIGDASGDGLGWLSWPSPIGWWQQTRPYAGDRWWVLVVLLAFAAAVSAVAYVLAARRDFGAGILPDRPGPASAAPTLRTPLALAWRLQRGTVLTWVAAFAVVGVVAGSVSGSAGEFLKTPQAKDFIAKLGGGEQGLRDAFLAVELGMYGLITSVFGILSALRLRSEESAQRADPVLAASVRRTTWLWSHVTIALGGSALLLAVVGVAAGLVTARQVGDIGQLGRVVGAALAQLPAVWLIVGIVVAVFGLAPRLVVLGWVALVGFALLGEFGQLFNFSQTVMDVSPFAHVPRLGGHFSAAPILWLTAIAAGLVLIGLSGFRRRDVG